MSDAKIAKGWGAGCSRTALIAILTLVFFMAVLVGLVVLSLSLPLQREQQITLWSTAFFLILVLVPVVILIIGLGFIKRQLRRADAAFAPFGLSARSYLWNGRQYHGMLSGRQVDVYIYRGPTLDVYVSSSLNTRLGIGLKGSLSRLAAASLQRPPLVAGDPAFDALSIDALDEEWGRQLLAEPLAREIILRLAASPPGLEFRNLRFQPEAVQFQLNHFNLDMLTTENLHSWLDDLLELARVAESLPPPAITSTASPLEHRARSNRGELALPVVGIACGLLALLVLIGLIMMFVALLTAQGGGM